MILKWEQFNESFFDKKINLNHIKQNVELFNSTIEDATLYNLFLPYRDKIENMYSKYLNGKSLDVNKIHNDIKRFRLFREENINESFIGNIGNMIVKVLKFIFVTIPKDIYDYLVMLFTGDTVDKILGSIFVILTSFLIFIFSIIGLHVRDYYEQKNNGIEHGVVKTEVEFVPAHTTIIPTYITTGKTIIIAMNTVHYPDKWFVEIENDKGRIETWSSTNPNSDTLKIGHSINRNDNWTWENTIEK